MERISFPFIFLSAYNRASDNLLSQLLTDVSLLCFAYCFCVCAFFFPNRTLATIFLHPCSFTISLRCEMETIDFKAIIREIISLASTLHAIMKKKIMFDENSK